MSNEDTICIGCIADLPQTGLHKINGSRLKTVFYGRTKIHLATALFYYHKKSKVRQLLHELKYRKQEQISFYLGKWLGSELSFCKEYATVDLVVPVPLHRSKLKVRGYNQVTGFGYEIAKSLQVPFLDNVLLRETATHSQTKKTRWLRSYNSNTVFRINPKTAKQLQNKHVLLVDDVITTGATIMACAKVLQEIDGLELSIATMAYTE